MSRDFEVSEDKFIKITYSALVYFLIGCTGLAAWMTAIQISIAANTDTLSRKEEQDVKVQESLTSIDKRLARMEIMMKLITKQGE